ncbi:unnamed protein product [Rhizophagus irregularis]|nr:unnamed protein product [Rhizophagus irregularis]
MNNSIIAVDILPDDDGKVMMYGAPNKDTTYLVSGKLRIILSKPLKTKLISIKLKGKSEYSDWENQYSCIYLLKLEKVLREKTTLPSGVTDLDFEFQVNGNIPQSYVTSFGLIRYNLVATVQPSSLLLKQGRAEKSINISRHYLPCRRELLPAPPTKVYRGQRKNILKYELDIPTVICINETSLLIRLRLFPLCNQGRVKKVAFDLIQSEKYRIQPTPQDYQEFSIEKCSTYWKYTWENPLTYNLPFEQYSTRNINNPIKKTKLKATIKSPLMRVRHKLKITMTFEALEEKTLELGFPITVTTLPGMEAANHHFRTNEDFNEIELPAYDDVVNHTLSQDGCDSNISRPVTPTPPPPFSDESTINLNTHTSHTTTNTSHTTNTSNTALTSNTSHTSHTINNTSHTSHTTNTTILSSSPPDSQLLSQPQPQLNKKKSQRSLAQALGRLLLRSESSSRPNSPSPSASTTPTVLTPVTSSYPNNNNRSRTHPQLEVTPSSSPTFAPHNQPTSSTNSANNIVYQGIGNLYTRTGRASWYLNMPDDDDAPTLTPEIHSAPSSPRESLVHIPSSNNLLPPPNQQRRNKNNIPSDRMIHRRSISFDSSLTQSIINESSIPSGSTTTQTRSNNDNPSENSSISSLLRHPSINSLKGMVKRRKKPATIDDNTSRLAINRIDINITIPSPTLGTYNLN